MKKIILSIMFLGIFGFAASSTSAQYTRIPNAAISGHNTRTMNGSVSDCKRVCTANGWCKSFDYHKGKNKCDLSNKNRQDVGLKTNYGGNPYDHYSKILTRTSSCNPNANQIAIFLDANYQGKCTVRNVGRYSSPNLLGMPNDSISSIKVGRNVYATVCRDYNYGGICEDIKTSDRWLGNNSRIKNDQVSSVIVRRKNTFVPTPRASTVYTGCGYTYKTKNARDTQCGRGGTSKWIGDGVDESKMKRGQTVYTGCGYTYASRTERDKQCGSGGTSKWIRE